MEDKQRKNTGNRDSPEEKLEAVKTVNSFSCVEKLMNTNNYLAINISISRF